MLWVGVGGHRSLLMGMVWVWVQIRRKMLGSASRITKSYLELVAYSHFEAFEHNICSTGHQKFDIDHLKTIIDICSNHFLQAHP